MSSTIGRFRTTWACTDWAEAILLNQRARKTLRQTALPVTLPMSLGERCLWVRSTTKPWPIERVLQQHSSGAGSASYLGVAVFIHRFGALLNTHLHFHCVIVDAAFDADAAGGVSFHPASALDTPAIGEVRAAVRGRVLQARERRGLPAPEDAQAMAAREQGGDFSVDAAVRIEPFSWSGMILTFSRSINGG